MISFFNIWTLELTQLLLICLSLFGLEHTDSHGRHSQVLSAPLQQSKAWHWGKHAQRQASLKYLQVELEALEAALRHASDAVNASRAPTTAQQVGLC